LGWWRRFWVVLSRWYNGIVTVFRCGLDRWYSVIRTFLHVYSVFHIYHHCSKIANGTIQITTVTIPIATGYAVIPIPTRSIPNPANR